MSEETWTCTNELRWEYNYGCQYPDLGYLLYQKWVDEKGNEEWREVPVHRD
jgi:hypothetical protein